MLYEVITRASIGNFCEFCNSKVIEIIRFHHFPNRYHIISGYLVYICKYRITSYNVCYTKLLRYGAAKEYTCEITVVNTNRAPEVVTDLSDQTLHINYDYRFNFGELFADPDGDLLTYTLTTDVDSVVEIFTLGSEAIIVPVEKHMVV